MQPCPRVVSCPLFAQFKVKSSLKVWQSFFCEGTFEKCERYKLVSEGKVCAPNLLPNGRLLEVPLEQLAPRHFE
jgi:hypothetical protein